MKITILSGPFLPMPPAPCGAVERVWDGLARKFVARGHEVTVLSSAHPGLSEEEVVGGVQVIRRGGFARRRRLAANLALDFAYSVGALPLLPKADILVTNTFWMPGLLSLWNRSAGRLAVHVQRVPKGQMRLYSTATRFQAVSTAIRDAVVREIPWAAGRVKVFPNPVHTDVFTPPPARRIGPESTILFTGRVNPEKGLDVLVTAFGQLAAEFPRLRLRIVGPWRTEHGGGGADYLARLKAQAAGRAVEFCDPVFDLSRLADVYRSADLYCYPTLAEAGEASPVAPVEAMAAGLVPVVSDIPQFRDTITPGETGETFDHRSPDRADRLVAAFRKLITDPERTGAMGREAARWAARFGYEQVADQYLDDFRQMLSGGRGR